LKIIAFLIMAAAWVCIFVAPRSAPSRLVQFLIFGILGAVLVLAGGFSYWWDSGMRPSEKSPFLLICGILTLASQASTMLVGFLGDEGGTSWPDRPGRRK